MKIAKRLIVIAVLAVAGYAYLSNHAPSLPDSLRFDSTDSQAIAHAYHDRHSSTEVSGEGTVVRILADDREGSRHQRFILRLSNGLTLLVAHNIDLAPRIGSLREGDTVAFRGEYEWNAKGGVLHWTHHDPQGHHAGGWLKHAGRTYQ